MKKFIFSFVLCIMSITGFVYNAHALNPYAVMQEAKNGLVGSQFLLGVLYSTGAESEVIGPNLTRLGNGTKRSPCRSIRPPNISLVPSMKLASSSTGISRKP